MDAVGNTTLPCRAGIALLIGAVLGAALVWLGTVGSTLMDAALERGATYHLSSALMLSLLVFGAAFAVFAAGLFILAAPAWWVLHRLGLRRWFHAVAFGAALSFGAAVGLTVLPTLLPPPGSTFSSGDSGGPLVVNNRLTRHGGNNALRGGALVSVAGAIVGLAIWGLAYGRDPLCDGRSE